jgi:nucleoside-diphosphate-sugar epimerase
MAASPKDILVFGATGLIGSYIISELIAAKQSFGRLAIFTSEDTVQRKSTEIAALKEKGVDVIVGDITNAADIQRAYQGIDTVVSAVGRPIIDLQIKLLEIAEATPTVRLFYPSEFGTDIEYWPHSKDERPHQLKLKVRKYIAEHVNRVQHTYLVTGPYADGYIGRSRDPRAGAFNVQERKATLLGTGEERISLTTMREYLSPPNTC